ncbi:MAG: thymidine kinase [Acidobacteriota bacterium]|nr:thymidine kinase [Acidobacteriota bacterium]
MAKLYFRYGTVGSAKTLNLLAVAHNYTQQGKRVLLIKPELDVRWDKQQIRSRAGLERKADLLVRPDTVLDEADFEGIDCVLVDEAQFLSTGVIDQLRALTTQRKVPVICYGLRTDFRTQLFPGSERLMAMADSIEEVKTTCAFCNKKAIFNLKFLNGEPTLAGPSIDLGAEEKYLPACYRCYNLKLADERALAGATDGG